MMKLYEISAEMRALGARIEAYEASDEAIPGDVLSDLECLTTGLEEKIVACAGLAREWDAEADAVKAEADRLTARAARLRKKADGLRGYVLATMQTHHVGPIKTPAYTVRIALNPPAVSIPDPGAFCRWAAAYAPELLRLAEPAPDKKAVAALLKDEPAAIPEDLRVSLTRSHKLAVA